MLEGSAWSFDFMLARLPSHLAHPTSRLWCCLLCPATARFSLWISARQAAVALLPMVQSAHQERHGLLAGLQRTRCVPDAARQHEERPAFARRSES
jgi:polyferredoxin